ncbi:MAG TPA: GNAT family N-acetyltransferase, partial [Polyangiaceae bacterium]
KQIQPRLNGMHRYLGPVRGARKRELLSNAKALLVPSRVPETSSLVSMEALASGTPVVAYPFGALPTIVEHGETGFVVGGIDDMADAIGRVRELEPTHCRERAVERFSAASMVGRYLSIYERLAEENARPRRHAAGRLHIEGIHGLRALACLKSEWAELTNRDPHATPFQRPEWLLAYARAFCGLDPDASDPGKRALPWALVARQESRLVGMLPLCTREAVGQARVSLLGDGLSDHLDMIVEPARALECARLFMGALVEQTNIGKELAFDELRQGSPLNTVVAPAGLCEERLVQAPCPVLRLMAGIDALPTSMRAKVRYYTRRAERLGRVEVEVATHSAVGAWLETLFELHGKRWTSRGEAGVFATPSLRQFQREATCGLADSGYAKLFGLRIDGKPAAAMLLLDDGATAYYYIGGFDPAWAEVSPGTLLIAHAIDEAQERGLCEFDSLRGNEGYKYRFGAHDRFNYCRHFTLTKARSNDHSRSARG